MDVAFAVCPRKGPAAGWRGQACAVMPEAPSRQAPPGQATPWQAALFAFAISELVRQHRESFEPLWTVDSWAKLLIWLALSSGCGTDPASLEGFAAGLGQPLSSRLRRVFFERELDDLNLRLLADPAEEQAIALPIEAQAGGPEPRGVLAALERVGLSERLAPPEHWRQHEGLIALPWRGKPAP